MLQKLKEYKELISIIVFFVGGLSWIQAQYPNKQDLKTVNCKLDNYMKLTQLQIRSQDLDKKRSELSRRLSSASSGDGNGNIALSPAMVMELDQMKLDYNNLSEQYRQTASDMTKIKDDLERDVCGRSGQ